MAGIPTVKLMVKRGFSPEEAAKIRQIMTLEVEPEAMFDDLPEYNDWPSRAMAAIDRIMGGYGVEVLRDGSYWDSYYQDHRALYVNMGDTYDLTIIYDHAERRFQATSYGDWLEWAEKHGFQDP